jgi:hypothetical protein
MGHDYIIKEVEKKDRTQIGSVIVHALRILHCLEATVFSSSCPIPVAQLPLACLCYFAGY